MDESSFLIIHAGAGFHAERKRSSYKKLLKHCLQIGVQSFNEISTAVDCVERVVCHLEDSPLTNAGCGSNLSLDGTVESEALVSDGKSCGSVAAIIGFKNPIKCARAVFDNQLLPSQLGRVPPCFLVAQGAERFLEDKGIEKVPADLLLTKESRSIFNEACARLCKELKAPSLCTVGALAYHNNTIAVANSSGGILLKHPGRIGPSCLFGVGSWASYQPEMSLAITVTGIGEQIMKTNLASTIGHQLFNVNVPLMFLLKDNFQKFYIESSFLDNEEPLVGIIVLRKSSTAVELAWIHSSKSFAIGYGTSSHLKYFVSEKLSKVEKTFELGGVNFSLKDHFK